VANKSRVEVHIKPENRDYLDELKKQIDEPTISAALDRVLDELRGYTSTELFDYLQQVPVKH
jgi:hypothetical protein